MVFAFTWIIPGVLAQSPRPALSDVPEISEVFAGVVNLLSDVEKPHQLIRELASRGVEVFHAPTPDFHPVELVYVLGAVDFIEKHASRGCRVLVHCAGGVGRSSQVTASYLIYTGLSLLEAVEAVRSRVPGALEVPWQFRLVEDFATLVELVGRNKTRQLYRELESALGRRGLLHFSKLLQFSIELAGIAGVEEGELREAVYELLEAGGGRRSGWASALLRLAEILDYDASRRVVVLDGDRLGDRLEVRLLCNAPCWDIAERLQRAASEEGFGEVVAEAGLYMDYV